MGCLLVAVVAAAAVHIKTEIIVVQADGGRDGGGGHGRTAAIGATAAVGGSTLANTFATALVIK